MHTEERGSVVTSWTRFWSLFMVTSSNPHKHTHELSVTPAESCYQCCWTASRTAELRPAAAPAKAAEFIIKMVTGNSSSSLIPSALTAPGLTGIVGGRPRGWAHHLIETCIYFQGAVILSSCSNLQKCGGCQNNHIIMSAVVSGPPSWSCFPSYIPNLSWRWVWFQQKVTTLSKKIQILDESQSITSLVKKRVDGFYY